MEPAYTVSGTHQMFLVLTSGPGPNSRYSSISQKREYKTAVRRSTKRLSIPLLPKVAILQLKRLRSEESLGPFNAAIAIDAEGQPHPLKNDSICGVWVAPNRDGSMVVKVAVAGCYVEAHDGNYQAVIQIEGLRANGQKTSYKQVLKCPETFQALDSPGPSLCSSVQAPDRVPCSTYQVSQGECEDLGCCYNSRDRVAPCYYGDKVTAHCTPEGQFSIAISRDATRPPLVLDSVRLLSSRGRECAPVSKTNTFILFQFPLSACGTTLKATGSQRVYENELLADRRVLVSQSGSITRDSNFRVTIRCSYSAEAALPVSVLVATLAPPAAVVEQGPLTLEMRLARDVEYSSYYADLDYPVVKVLRDPVPVEVRILGRMDPALVLVLHECWATPSSNPLQKPEWPLLENGCPYKGDNYQTQVVPIRGDSGLPFPSHHQRFIVSTFTFVETASQRMLTGPVYFHCSASACVPSRQERCIVRCEVTAPGRRQRTAEEHPEEKLVLVTLNGPVNFSSPQEAEMLPHQGLQRFSQDSSVQ
ncbi:PREDICTED: zona pellucida sperm-binding protein 4-like [Gekko japonicus]|uniref:Zona pellucida sperm-binding protein 4 n=1 Tax=Gekko japonicus TaxID=146911 RepID=A0ABM1KYR0_GEKJA|nr:PREDICTED: zona pellucida sperm-binding protein 4-like [Gekko japonicus]